MRRVVIIASLVGLAVVVVGVSIVVGFVGEQQTTVYVSTPHAIPYLIGGGFDWELFALTLAGLGTLALAMVTGVVAATTWQDVRASQRTANAIAEQVATDRTPLVYPVAPRDWALMHRRYEHFRDETLVITNGGRGLARRVSGWVSWDDRSGAHVWPTTQILPTTIAAGETQDVRLDAKGVKNWLGAYGGIDYEDVSGLPWRTYFEFHEDSAGRIYVEVKVMDERWRTGDPPERGPISDSYGGPPLPGSGADPFGVDVEEARARSREGARQRDRRDV